MIFIYLFLFVSLIFLYILFNYVFSSFIIFLAYVVPSILHFHYIFKIWCWLIYVVIKPLINLFTLKMVGSCTSRHLLCGAATLLLFAVVLFYSINYLKIRGCIHPEILLNVHLFLTTYLGSIILVSLSILSSLTFT